MLYIKIIEISEYIDC